MGTRILVNAIHPEECRVAILENGILQDIHIETGSKEHTKGNIYQGVIVRVEPGLEAAFVDFGRAKHGFLQFREIHESNFSTDGGGGKKPDRPRIQDVIRKRQKILVQVEKEERDQKGASLTTYLSLAGRYIVAMPGHGKLGISRKIEGEKERTKIREVFQKLDPPADMGFIVRTAAAGQTKATLSRDLKYLLNLWKKIRRDAEKAPAPALIHREEDIVIRAIRDYLTTDVDEVLIDHPETYRNAREFFKNYQPKYQRLIKLYREPQPLFAAFGVEEQIEVIHHRRVPLPSGGSIVIESGEALTAIDVNSGKTHGEQDIETLALHTNLEAVAEIARQLRLRDLGGLIVVDFIDMRPMKNNREVERAFKQALKKDKAHTDTTRISRFGLLELSRERLRPSFRDIHYVPCTTCRGSGHVKTAESLSLYALRRLQAAAASDEHIISLTCRLPVDAANYVMNRKQETLAAFKAVHGITPEILGDVSLPEGNLIIEIQRDEGNTEVFSSLESSEAVQEAKRRKKKRKRKKNKSEEHTHAAETAETDAPDTAAPDEPGKKAADDASADEERPKRKRPRRRRRKRPANAPESGETKSEETSAEKQKPEADDTLGATETVVDILAVSAPESVEASPESQAASEAPSSRSRRRRRRKTTSGKTAASEKQPAATSVEPEPEPEPESETETAPKPKKTVRRRRRSSRTTKAEADRAAETGQSAETGQPAESGESAAAPAEPEKAPRAKKKAPARKKTTTRKTVVKRAGSASGSRPRRTSAAKKAGVSAEAASVPATGDRTDDE